MAVLAVMALGADPVANGYTGHGAAAALQQEKS